MSIPSSACRRTRLLFFVVMFAWTGAASADDREKRLQSTFETSIRGLLKSHCFECHDAKLSEAEIDLEAMHEWPQVRNSSKTLQRILEQLHSKQMPPPDAKQLSDIEYRQLNDWVSDWLAWEAERHADDPGPVILRRLNNAEYTYTLRDLTGLRDLEPAKEFPADSAAGEGFSNSGAALVMSPAMIQKYLDAAKEIAGHAVLLPDGIRFESSPSPNDMTNVVLEAIRNFYAKYTDSQGGETVNLQGIVFETNQGGRLPVERYIAGTLEARDAFAASNKDGRDPTRIDAIVERIAADRNLNPKYLRELWQMFASTDTEPQTQGLMESLRRRWNTTGLADADQLSAEVLSWQRSLWRFTTIGHIGKVNGPKAWQEAVDPIREVQEIRFPIPSPVENSDAVFYLQVADAGDGSEDDVAVLERPRLVAPGRPEILLKDLAGLMRIIDSKQSEWSTMVDETLMAMVPVLESPPGQDWDALARVEGLDPKLLRAWGQYLGVDSQVGVPAGQRVRLSQKIENLAGYEAVDGWVAEDALSIVANASDSHVRIPGNMPGKTIGVHPSPARGIGVAWRAPEVMQATCVARVRHAHTECGNGVAWRLEHRRGSLRQVLASGFSNGATDVPVGPIDALRVRAGEELVLMIEPREGNHSCDLTNIDFEIRSESEKWDLASDISLSILDGNPHADARGRPGVWEFFSEPVASPNPSGMVIPSGSLLSQWFNSPDTKSRQELAVAMEQLVLRKAHGLAADSPDGLLYRQLVSANGPFFMAALSRVQDSGQAFVADATSTSSTFGIDSQRFGVAINGTAVPEMDCVLRAPQILTIRIPANLALGSEFVASGKLHSTAGRNGSLQISVSADAPKMDGVAIPKTTVSVEDANWAVPSRRLLVASPILVNPKSQAEQRIRSGFDTFRHWFPIALCYPKIVPVDEVVTLTLFYREDEPLQRLMLSASERMELDRLWSELHFVSQDPLKLVDAYEQLWQYATQDADPSAFEPLREPILRRAEAFRDQLAAAEPNHLRDAILFAERAYRGSMTEARERSLRDLYDRLRHEELSHADAIRFVLARVLVAPEFLYRTEIPGSGLRATAVSPFELANRLSYFLWSSAPDAELLQVASDGSLVQDEVLEFQVRRMLRDPKTERMAVEFGCMWLHIRDFDQLDEKSDAHFPEFKDIRGDLYRESILWISDLIRNDGSVADFLDANHTFLNENLASYYGVPNVAGPEWRRVDGIRAYGRGGILGLGATLAKQSGASRTSPILRGTWLSEVVLGEKLPKPPKNVPVLSETPPEGMTERELIERHSSDPACAKCHVRIDPFGFALEGYDAIGRLRARDSLGLPINTKTVLPDGTHVSGMEQMRSYLSEQRQEDFFKQFNRKLLGFSLGRSVQLSDGPLLARIRQDQKQNGSKLSDTIVRIVLSPPFRQIRGRDHSEESISVD